MFFWPFIVGWIIALIANPLVHLLEHRVKIVRKHGSAIVIVLTLAIVISLLYFIFYVLIKQGISFAHNFPEMYAKTRAISVLKSKTHKHTYQRYPLSPK